MPAHELPDALIIECAERLGASTVPIEAIQKAWMAVMSNPYGRGCLNNDSGKKLFIAYRLREFGCFEVGCQSDEEFGSGCVFHFFDIYSDSRNLTDEEYIEFMISRHKYRMEEARYAATKLWKLLDSHPVNVVAGRVADINRRKD